MYVCTSYLLRNNVGTTRSSVAKYEYDYEFLYLCVRSISVRMQRTNGKYYFIDIVQCRHDAHCVWNTRWADGILAPAPAPCGAPRGR